MRIKKSRLKEIIREEMASYDPKFQADLRAKAREVSRLDVIEKENDRLDDYSDDLLDKLDDVETPQEFNQARERVWAALRKWGKHTEEVYLPAQVDYWEYIMKNGGIFSDMERKRIKTLQDTLGVIKKSNDQLANQQLKHNDQLAMNKVYDKKTKKWVDTMEDSEVSLFGSKSKINPRSPNYDVNFHRQWMIDNFV